MTSPVLAGSWVALVTPFRNGSIDRDALFRLLDLHIAAKTDGLVICGTTGESVTLSTAEKADLMENVTKRINGRIPLMLGTGSNNTASTVESTRNAADLGAEAVLVVTPYYNKPPQNGLIAHFREVAAATELPVVLYNVPGRTGVNLLPGSVLELARTPGTNIKAIKEASGNIEQAMDILRAAPPGFSLLSGEDALNLPLMMVGATGTISVTGNVDPRRMKIFNDAARAAQWNEARSLHFELLDLHRAMFLEANPIPVKAALNMMGLIGDEYRLPLIPATSSTREKLAVILGKMGLTKN
ncbi:MAG: 4-hydroxy-tetrahydrodipicolinate synthase [Candidatus Riflebacteria bacterium]|nr:4-hydroxy-tetrahydrodipicolinate synthase [Candidatus Riflebacteria bacterium]